LSQEHPLSRLAAEELQLQIYRLDNSWQPPPLRLRKPGEWKNKGSHLILGVTLGEKVALDPKLIYRAYD
jgi:hypothetical protein